MTRDEREHDAFLAPELRIHGVGGSPGPRLLGYDDLSSTTPVYRRQGIVVRARRDQRWGLVEGFDWGSLSSGSPYQALWILLLPFTLLNVAGWAHAPSRQGDRGIGVRVTHATIVVLGWFATATTSLWLADLLVDYAGYQWLPRATGRKQFVVTLLPWWHQTLTPRFIQAGGAVTGAILVLGLLVAARVLAGRARSVSNEPDRRHAAFETGSGLFDGRFFKNRPSWAASTAAHFTIAALAVVLTGYLGINAAFGSPEPAPRTAIDVSLLVVIGAQFVLLLVVGAATVVVPLARRRPANTVPWASAMLAFVLVNAFFSGCVLWLSAHLSGYLSDNNTDPLSLGRELALADVFFYLALAWALILGLIVVHRMRIRGLPDPCPDREPIPAHWSRSVRKAQGTARIIHKIDLVLVALAATTVIVSLVLLLPRVHGASLGRPPWRWTLDSPAATGIGYRAAAWFLPASTVFVLVRVRKAARDNRLRRFFGQAWDVLTFWPRRFHPFAVRPYSHIAIPELQRDMDDLRREHGRLVVSAHSQGAVLAVAALLPMQDLRGIRLVTYGSPVGTLYRRGFPAYFNDEMVAQLSDRLRGAGGENWHNFYRLTDPIGGPVFGALGPSGPGDPRDHCLSDPAAWGGYSSAASAPPLEQLREPEAGLAIHSYFLNEGELQEFVRRIKESPIDR